MTLPIFPKQAVDMMRDVNGRPYDAKTNPKGLANGGHRQVFPDSLQAMVEGLTYTQQVALALEVLARLVETSTADAQAAKDEIIRIQGDTETFAIRALAAAQKVEGAASMQMSDAGRNFVQLSTTSDMFAEIKKLANNSTAGVVWLASESSIMNTTNVYDAVTPAALEYWRVQKGLGAMDYSRRGYVSTSDYQLKAGSNEEASYFDIPISPVSDYTKCHVDFVGGYNKYSRISAFAETTRSDMSAFQTYKVVSKLTSNNNLRVSTPAFEYANAPADWRVAGFITGYWTVGVPS